MQLITDQTVLRQISQKVSPEEQASIIASLKESLPDNSLGMAAPQIGILKRAFLAKLDNVFYAFINPELTYPNEYTNPSVEQCLSLPEITRCVTRHTTVQVKADAIVNLETSVESTSREYAGQSAFVLQHENDHLNGVLLVDLPEAKSFEDMAKEKQQKKLNKIKGRQTQEKAVAKKVNAVKRQKELAEYKKSAKRLAKSAWIQDAYLKQLAERRDILANSQPESPQA